VFFREVHGSVAAMTMMITMVVLFWSGCAKTLLLGQVNPLVKLKQFVTVSGKRQMKLCGTD